TSAPAKAAASDGFGSQTWASPLGPTSVVMATRSPPTFLAKSAMIEKLATTFNFSAEAVASGAGVNAITLIRAASLMVLSIVLFLPVRLGGSVMGALDAGVHHPTRPDENRNDVDDAGSQ